MAEEESIVLFNNHLGLTTITPTEYTELTCTDISKPWSVTNDNVPENMTLWRCIDDKKSKKFGDIVKPVCSYREMQKFSAAKFMNTNLVEKFTELYPKLPPSYIGVHFDTVISRLESHRGTEFQYHVGIYTDSDKMYEKNNEKLWLPFIHTQLSCWGIDVLSLPLDRSENGNIIQDFIKEKTMPMLIDQISLFSHHKLFTCSCEPPKWYKDKYNALEKTIYNYATDLSGEQLSTENRIKLQETIDRLQNVKVGSASSNQDTS